jgi:hypothetical protein
MSKEVIFQELHAASGDIIQLISFVHAFYAFESLLFYNHYNHEGRCYSGSKVARILIPKVHVKVKAW